MRRRASPLSLALLLVLEGCGRRSREIEADASAAALVSAADAARAPDADASRNADASPTPSDDAGEADDLAGPPRTARSIGHTSVVLKLELPGGKRAVFKPASRRGPLRYRGEIAAYRLGAALGLPNVPRAFFRAIDARALSAAAGAGNAATAELFTKEAIVSGDVVKGALIPWIEGLGFVELARDATWKTWLRRDGVIPGDQRTRAQEISTLVCFDFLTGNWDRWSGGNVGLDKASGRLLFIDNDGAFFEVPPTDALQKNKRLLIAIERFSRSFIAQVRALDDDALDRAIGDESPGVALLSARALAGVHQRRRALLAIVDAKRADAGDDALLPFP